MRFLVTIFLALIIGACGAPDSKSDGRNGGGQASTPTANTDPNPSPGDDQLPAPLPTPKCMKCGRNDAGRHACVAAHTGGKECTISNGGLVCGYVLDCASGHFSPGGWLAFHERANNYFGDQVFPDLEPCWSQLIVDSDISFVHNFKLGDDRRWHASDVTLDANELPQDQLRIALECMGNAVADTSFPAQSSDATGETLSLYWDWPSKFE